MANNNSNICPKTGLPTALLALLPKGATLHPSWAANPDNVLLCPVAAATGNKALMGAVASTWVRYVCPQGSGYRYGMPAGLALAYGPHNAPCGQPCVVAYTQSAHTPGPQGKAAAAALANANSALQAQLAAAQAQLAALSGNGKAGKKAG